MNGRLYEYRKEFFVLPLDIYYSSVITIYDTWKYTRRFVFDVFCFIYYFSYVSITTGQLTLVWHEWISDVPEIHSCDDLHVSMTMNMKRLILKFLIASIY